VGVGVEVGHPNTTARVVVVVAAHHLLSLAVLFRPLNRSRLLREAQELRRKILRQLVVATLRSALWLPTAVGVVPVIQTVLVGVVSLVPQVVTNPANHTALRLQKKTSDLVALRHTEMQFMAGVVVVAIQTVLAVKVFMEEVVVVGQLALVELVFLAGMAAAAQAQRPKQALLRLAGVTGVV